MNRRDILSAALALPAATLAPHWGRADLQLGDATLTTVSDGTLTLPGGFIFDGLPQDALQVVLDTHGLSADRITPPCNLALYRDGTRNVLFDVGSGPDFMPSAGKIVDGLAAVNLAPADITHVVFTHAHPDHIWGLLDDFDDPLFSEATYMMGRSEWDYWWNPETVNTIGEARAAFAVGAKRRMEAIEDAVTFISDGDEILPGLQAVSTPGHTPGHMAFEIRHGGTAALVAGDAIGNHHVAFAHPDWRTNSDQDPDTAATTRLALFDRILTDDLHLVGFHLPDGGMGRVDRVSGGYTFVAGDT